MGKVGRFEYDAHADLWSLGVTIYVMVMGCYPFDGVDENIELQVQNPRLSFRSPTTGREPSIDVQNLISSLIKVAPKDRLSLDQCLRHAWIGAALQQRDEKQNVFSLRLPYTPDKNQRNSISADLALFQRKFKCFAAVYPQRVNADFTGMDAGKIKEAQSDLSGIVKYHIQSHCEEEWLDSITGNCNTRLPTIVEPTYKLTTTFLRLDRDGAAGIETEADTTGMQVTAIYSSPGQPGVRVGDLIVKINEVALAGSADRVEKIFGSNFFNGVQIQVKRLC